MIENIKKNKYYVYIWYKENTLDVFYVGKGINNRANNTNQRNNYFKKIINKYNCNNMIIKYCESEQEALNIEEMLISHYKAKNLAQANFASGGNQSSSIRYLSQEDYNKFVEKMTTINRERCSTPEFKEKKRTFMVEKYKHPENRIKQSKKIKEAWNNQELRKKQSDIIKNTYNSELRDIRKKAMERKTFIKINNLYKVFNSQQDALSFLKEEYNFSPNRRTIKQLIDGETYHAYHKRFLSLDGLQMGYL